jgi:tRNA dimethylallyltransferase
MIFILGPTASGKSAIALELAERLPVEIVSVDSALVYRGLDIGTAKPSLAERARVAHHLIDLIEPNERYSAARFASDASRLIEDIETRGHLPLLVGGTMLYAKALIEGLHELPAADPHKRNPVAVAGVHVGLQLEHKTTEARCHRFDQPSAAGTNTGRTQTRGLGHHQRQSHQPQSAGAAGGGEQKPRAAR